MTPFENRPCSNSTSESIPPAHRAQIARHLGFVTGATLTTTV